MKNFGQKLIILALASGLVAPGIVFAVQPAGGYVDTETSDVNTFSAGSLDFSLNSGTDFSPSITPTQTSARTISVVDNGTLGFQYTLQTENETGDLCDYLNLTASRDGADVVYTGNLKDFIYDAGQFADPGEWQFTTALIGGDLSLQNKTCNFDLVFNGSQIGGIGFFDSETISNSVTAGYWSVVLNEFLPNPEGVAYGSDFGNNSSNMPQGEWVELYNKSDADLDLSGWYIKDNLESDVNKIMITTSNTAPADTTIRAKSWLVVYMNKAVLNNTGDTVKLFDASGNPVDSYTYSGGEYCDLEPTPGDDNDNPPSGSCSSVSANKSFARIPDGTGAWVDPIPTPGSPNTLECAEQSFGLEIIPQAALREEIQEPQQEEIIPPPAEEAAVEGLPVEEPVIVPEEPVAKEPVIILEDTTSVQEEPVVVSNDEINHE